MAYHYHYNNKNINISEAMDPQLRLLLEVAYEAFENGMFGFVDSMKMTPHG